MKITFVKVQDNGQKLHTICALAHLHFYKKDSFHILTQNNTAAAYIDDLLWKFPVESFLPHGRVGSGELLQIIIEGESSIQPAYLLNLSENHSVTADKVLYELLDESHPQKKAISEKKLQFYQSHNFEVNFMTPDAIGLPN